MSQLPTYLSNFIEFQPGMTVTLYTNSGPLIFRSIQALSFLEIDNQVVLQLTVPEGKVIFKDWIGIGCGMKSTTADFQIKG